MKKAIMFFMLAAGFLIVGVSTTNAADDKNDVLAFLSQVNLRLQLINLASVNQDLQIVLVQLLQAHQDFLERQMKYQTQALSELSAKIDMIELNLEQYALTAVSWQQAEAEKSWKKLARLKDEQFWLSEAHQEYFLAQQTNQRALAYYDRKKYFFGVLELVIRQNVWQKDWAQIKPQLEQDNELLIEYLSVARKLCAGIE